MKSPYRKCFGTKELQEKGYRVIRLWESEINIMDLENFKDKITREEI